MMRRRNKFNVITLQPLSWVIEQAADLRFRRNNITLVRQCLEQLEGTSAYRYVRVSRNSRPLLNPTFYKPQELSTIPLYRIGDGEVVNNYRKHFSK